MLLGDYTLAWEGDQASDANITLNDDMTKHKGIAFEFRSAAITSNGFGCIFDIPVGLFKTLYINSASPLTSMMCSIYDNYYSYIRYIDEYTILFDFATTQRLRRIWFID